ncbi:MAG TPA: hypothetical protein VFQ61_21840 [Polyangiaceae bacterium]|nr:hypothetical protein [Polyangiaceae bacterium]
MNRLVFLSLGVFLAACGPSLEPDRVKSPDEIVAEQEALGAEQQKKGRDSGDYAEPSGATDDEKRQQWDVHYAALELRRASRSAETCPESVTEKTPKGKAHVTLVFGNDGHVKDKKIDDPYTETAAGKCVLRAMGAVIVKSYEGTERTVEYEVDLTGGKKSGPLGTQKEEEDKYNAEVEKNGQ